MADHLDADRAGRAADRDALRRRPAARHGGRGRSPARRAGPRHRPGIGAVRLRVGRLHRRAAWNRAAPGPAVRSRDAGHAGGGRAVRRQRHARRAGGRRLHPHRARRQPPRRSGRRRRDPAAARGRTGPDPHLRAEAAGARRRQRGAARALRRARDRRRQPPRRRVAGAGRRSHRGHRLGHGHLQRGVRGAAERHQQPQRLRQPAGRGDVGRRGAGPAQLPGAHRGPGQRLQCRRSVAPGRAGHAHRQGPFPRSRWRAAERRVHRSAGRPGRPGPGGRPGHGRQRLRGHHRDVGEPRRLRPGHRHRQGQQRPDHLGRAAADRAALHRGPLRRHAAGGRLPDGKLAGGRHRRLGAGAARPAGNRSRAPGRRPRPRRPQRERHHPRGAAAVAARQRRQQRRCAGVGDARARPGLGRGQRDHRHAGALRGLAHRRRRADQPGPAGPHVDRQRRPLLRRRGVQRRRAGDVRGQRGVRRPDHAGHDHHRRTGAAAVLGPVAAALRGRHRHAERLPHRPGRAAADHRPDRHRGGRARAARSAGDCLGHLRPDPVRGRPHLDPGLLRLGERRQPRRQRPGRHSTACRSPAARSRFRPAASPSSTPRTWTPRSTPC